MRALCRLIAAVVAACAISTWIVPPTVKKGARLRLVVRLSGEGGAKATATKSLRAP